MSNRLTVNTEKQPTLIGPVYADRGKRYVYFSAVFETMTEGRLSYSGMMTTADWDLMHPRDRKMAVQLDFERKVMARAYIGQGFVLRTIYAYLDQIDWTAAPGARLRNDCETVR